MARSRRRWAALTGAAITTLALACNGIIGLDDYRNVECTGGRCDAGIDGPSIDGGSDVLVGGDAQGTAPVSWAKFKMPNYDGGGADANIVSYTAPGNGEVTDNVSKLVWREPIAVADRGQKTLAQAQRICSGDWRLPSRIELVTLLDLSRVPAIDARFGSTERLSYWTTSEVRPIGTGTRERWTVNFDTGGLGKVGEDGSAGVRCIKVVGK